MTDAPDISDLAIKRMIRFLRQAQKLGCKCFVDIAFHMPKTWERIRHEPANRALFSIWLGWQRDPSIEQILSLPERDLAGILLCHPVSDAHSAWMQAPMLCHRMHVCGRLSGVFRYLDFRADKRGDFSVPPEDANLAYLESGGNFEALLVLQLDGLDHAHRHALSRGLLWSLPCIPEDGWPTRGGPVYSVTMLMLARMLERLKIDFVTPSIKLEAKSSTCPGCISLPAHGVELGFGKPVPYAERQNGGRHRTVLIDEHLRHGPGALMALYMHMQGTLSELGISTELLSGIQPYPDLIRPTPQGTS